ncbi:MAG TPA: hypothetical protein VGO50_13575 [Pyrinomonadaceae bacterium]|nr:hypothetical protein [Pyrinomonadaceae bacterium]
MNESEAQSVPQLDKRTEKLKPFLHSWLKKVCESQNEDFQLSDIFPLQIILEEKDEGTQRAQLENGIDREQIVSELEEMLASDSHLLKCCVTYNRLAMWLDRFIAEAYRLNFGKMPDDARFEEFFDAFLEETYKESFRSKFYSHVFNLTCEQDSLDFGDLKIQKLDLSQRFRVLGDHSTLSLLHPHHNIGEYFIVSKTSELIKDDWEWQFDERVKAEDFARLFQYFKDGVVHINYSIVRFYPAWVNTIRFGGLAFSGAQRRFPHENGGKMYSISDDEYHELIEWLSLYKLPEVEGKFDLPTEEKNALGKKIELAGVYFEASHTHNELFRKLIDLAIALELIFHPHNKDEISFQLSQLGAQFLGADAAQKKEIFKDIKLMYTKRSDVFHGNQEQQEKKPVTLEEVERWSGLIRRSMVKLITLYIRGRENHKEIIQQIRDSLFDPVEFEKLEQESNLLTLIEEIKAREH